MFPDFKILFPAVYSPMFRSVLRSILSAAYLGNNMVTMSRNRLHVPQFIAKQTNKQKKSDIYTWNLAIADLAHIIGMPFLIHQWAHGGEWVFGSLLCTIITSLDTCNQLTCSAIMTAMSLDRYVLSDFHSIPFIQGQ